VNPTRLFVLSALAKHGPMYGHQLRRDARMDRAELWSEDTLRGYLEDRIRA
jgi:hypothetical protein